MLGNILSSHPAAFQMYEPLYTFGFERVMTSVNKDDLVQLEILQQLITCDFTGYSGKTRVKMSQLSLARKKPLESLHQRRTNYTSCIRIMLKDPKTKDLFFNGCKSIEECSHPDYLGAICDQIPVQVLKLDRLSLHAAGYLLKHPRLKKTNLKIIYEVRDPRATMASRKAAKWCDQVPFCVDHKILCLQLEADLEAARALEPQYPMQFM